MVIHILHIAKKHDVGFRIKKKERLNRIQIINQNNNSKVNQV
jgi:hypothetical protein